MKRKRPLHLQRPFCVLEEWDQSTRVTAPFIIAAGPCKKAMVAIQTNKRPDYGTGARLCTSFDGSSSMTLIDSVQRWFANYAQGASGCAAESARPAAQ